MSDMISAANCIQCGEYPRTHGKPIELCEACFNGYSKADRSEWEETMGLEEEQRSATRPDNEIEGFVGYIIGWVWELIVDTTEGYIVVHCELSCPVLSFAPTFTVWEDSTPDLVSVHKCAVCHGTR